MFTKAMKEYLKSPDRKGYNKSAYNSRLKGYSERGIKDLTLLAENASDKDLSDTVAKIFTAENLMPLICAIVSKHPSHEERLAICKVLVEEGRNAVHDVATKVLPWGLPGMFFNESQRVLVWVFAVRDAIKKASEKKPEVEKPSEVESV